MGLKEITLTPYAGTLLLTAIEAGISNSEHDSCNLCNLYNIHIIIFEYDFACLSLIRFFLWTRKKNLGYIQYKDLF